MTLCLITMHCIRGASLYDEDGGIHKGGIIIKTGMSIQGVPILSQHHNARCVFGVFSYSSLLNFYVM